MTSPYDDDRARIADLAQLFQAQAQVRRHRAGDAMAFVRLAYIARSVLDRVLGAGNPHSRRLTDLCDALDAEDQPPPLSTPCGALPERYGDAARILRAAALERMFRA